MSFSSPPCNGAACASDPDTQEAKSLNATALAGFDREMTGFVLQTVTDGIYVVDTERRIIFWNRGAEQLTGYSASEVVGMCCRDGLLVHVNKQGKCLCGGGCPLAETVIDGQQRNAEVYLRHRGGHRVPVHVESAPLRGTDGQVIGAVEIFRKNVAHETTEKTLRTLTAMSLRDRTTHLPNRTWMKIRLKAQLEESHAADTPLSVLMIEVDQYETLLSQHGVEGADAAVRLAGNALTSLLPDDAFAARWGDDVFLVTLVGMAQAEAQRYADIIRMLIEQSTLAGVGQQITASIGVAEAAGRDTAQQLESRVQEAMRHSKACGCNRVTTAAA